MRTPREPSSAIRGWERLLVGIFALGLAGFDSGIFVLDVVVRSLAWVVVLAALGVVELAMALYYRGRRRLEQH